MKLVEWNVQRASVSRFRRQMDAVNEREPDILALAEVGIRAGPKADKILGEHGFDHVAFSQTPLPDEETTASGVLFASRFPFETLPPREFGVEYPDRTPLVFA